MAAADGSRHAAAPRVRLRLTAKCAFHQSHKVRHQRCHAYHTSFDGTGPEHSSARIERFLQQTDEPMTMEEYATRQTHRALFCQINRAVLFKLACCPCAHRALKSEQPNLIVVNCTTPAQYFHVLRRQLARPYRKPLVIISPKTLLRHNDAVSSLQDMGNMAFKTR